MSKLIHVTGFDDTFYYFGNETDLRLPYHGLLALTAYVTLVYQFIMISNNKPKRSVYDEKNKRITLHT